jgi:hypothetical protein
MREIIRARENFKPGNKKSYFSATGAEENSPQFQLRVCGQKRKAPQGRQKIPPLCDSIAPAGLGLF